MEIIYLMLPAMLLFGIMMLTFLFWAVKSGQYEDIESQKYRIFFED